MSEILFNHKAHTYSNNTITFILYLKTVKTVWNWEGCYMNYIQMLCVVFAGSLIWNCCPFSYRLSITTPRFSSSPLPPGPTWGREAACLHKFSVSDVQGWSSWCTPHCTTSALWCGAQISYDCCQSADNMWRDSIKDLWSLLNSSPLSY